MLQREKLLSVQGLSCRVPGTTGQGKKILEDVSFSAHGGELIGLIGANGAGKSTLLRHVSGYLKAQTGTVELAGKAVGAWGDKERARLLAWVSQDAPSAFPFTVEDLVAMGRYPYLGSFGKPGPDDLALVADLIRYVGLDSQRDQVYSTLSGGERQRALFARALAQGSRLLVLDEPSASLDLSHEHRLFAMMGELCREGRCVISAVHNLNTAAEYCHRLVLLHQGRLVADGRPEEVLTVENLKTYFGYEAHVGKNPATGSVLVQHAPRPARSRTPKVHVIGGAGAALNTTRLLVRLGYRVSGGIAHGLDNDATLWQSLGLAHVRVEPFSHIDNDSWDRARAMVEESDLTVLGDFPFGPGNRRNLSLAAQAKNLVILGDPAHRRFFADGLAEEFQALVHRPGTRVLSWQDFAGEAESQAWERE